MIAVCRNEWFPRAFRCVDESVTVEVFCIDPATAERITAMETDAGYLPVDCSVLLDDGTIVGTRMFVCDGPMAECRKVHGGDWLLNNHS